MKDLTVYVHGKGGSAQETVSAFAKRYHADLTVMPGGEHWFHTGEQMQFLDHWIRERSLNDVCG